MVARLCRLQGLAPPLRSSANHEGRNPNNAMHKRTKAGVDLKAIFSSCCFDLTYFFSRALSLIKLDIMGNSKFTAHYWQHKCPAKSSEDGNNVHRGHPHIKYNKISPWGRNLKEGLILMGKECTVDDCKYKVNEETVILNKDGEEIRTLGGKNLYPERIRAYKLRCCKWWCRNRNTSGHSVDNPNFNELGNHCCTHALDYQDAIHNYKIKERLPGCTCVMVNMYNEDIEAWEPDGQRRGAVPGGPLDLDNRYHALKEARDVAAVHK